jgi:hypothetical protein
MSCRAWHSLDGSNAEIGQPASGRHSIIMQRPDGSTSMVSSPDEDASIGRVFQDAKDTGIYRLDPAIVRIVRIVDRCGAQNMGNVWVLCRNPMPLTLQDSALGTRLAASSGAAKRTFSFSLRLVANKHKKNENADAKETQPTLYGFRAVYVFEGLSRDLRPSLCALDVCRQCHFRKSPR